MSINSWPYEPLYRLKNWGSETETGPKITQVMEQGFKSRYVCAIYIQLMEVSGNKALNYKTHYTK